MARTVSQLAARPEDANRQGGARRGGAPQVSTEGNTRLRISLQIGCSDWQCGDYPVCGEVLLYRDRWPEDILQFSHYPPWLKTDEGWKIVGGMSAPCEPDGHTW